jgi:hypothetical protein
MPEERPMPRNRPKTRIILSVPVSPEQRAQLERRAGREPLSAYARGLLFPANDNAPPSPPRRIAAPVKDHAALASVLAKLGASGIAPSLQEMARLSRLGALPLSSEIEAAMQQACRDVADIKSLLMTALGIRER